MFDLLRTQFKHAGNIARNTAQALDFARKAQVFHGMTLRGVSKFVCQLPNIKLGPQVAVLFHALNHGDRDAVVGTTRFNYRELNLEINRLSHALASLGFSSGEAVALMLPNCTEHLVAQEAMPRVGGIAVQIGYRLKCSEIAHILDNSNPQVLIYHVDYEDEVRQAVAATQSLDETQILVVGAPETHEVYGSRYDDLLALQSDSLPHVAGSSEGGVIIYTSGTTGQPKGAARRWKDTGIESVTDMMARVGMRTDDRHLVVCPLYHSAAMAFVKMMIGLGATIILHEQFDAESVLQAIEKEKITSTFMVPTMLVRLNTLDKEIRDRYDLSSLRWVMSGAAPLATGTATEFQRKYGRILHNFYGATETGTVTHAGPNDHATHPGSVGRALRGNELRVLDEEATQREVGEVGELYVRNAMIIDGYYGNEDATLKSMHDGFFSVGDLARLDKDGYLYLASRKHDLVISGGVNIYPREIEEHLQRHPDIVEAAVIGIPDDDWGESLRAFVTPRLGSEVSAEDIIGYCRSELADYKQPRSVVFLSELPRTPTGKILKRELRQR